MAHVKAALELVKLGVELTKELVELGKDVMEAHEKYKEVKAGAKHENGEGQGRISGPCTSGNYAEEFAAAFAKLDRCRVGDNEDARYGVLDLKACGLYFKGHFVDEELEGQGEMRTPTFRYQGNLKEGEPDGEGRMVYTTSDVVYVGGWKMGERHGFGQLTTARGTETSLFD